MSVAEVESSLKQYIQKEGPLTVESTDDAEIAAVVGPEAGFTPGSEPAIGLLVAEALHDLGTKGIIAITKDHGEQASQLSYVPDMDEKGVKSSTSPEDIFGPIEAAEYRLAQQQNVLKFESDPEHSDTQTKIDAIRAQIETLLK
jgi:hypothetical protein